MIIVIIMVQFLVLLLGHQLEFVGLDAKFQQQVSVGMGCNSWNIFRRRGSRRQLLHSPTVYDVSGDDCCLDSWQCLRVCCAVQLEACLE
jgi:hypothetical protein